MVGEPRGERVLLIGHGQRVQLSRTGFDLAAQLLERCELRRGQTARGELTDRTGECSGDVLELADRADGCSRRVVDPVGQTRRQAAEGDE